MSGTKRVKFSVADFVIILMIIACIIGVAMRYDIAEKLFSKTKAEDVRVTFAVSSATDNTNNAFSTGAVFMYGTRLSESWRKQIHLLRFSTTKTAPAC